MLDGVLKKTSGYAFYNTSPFTFQTLLEAPADLETNFTAYCNGFSDNVRQILECFKSFFPHVATMARRKYFIRFSRNLQAKRRNCIPTR